MKAPVRTLVMILVTATLAIATSGVAVAKGAPKTKPKSTPAEHHTTIGAVSATSITIKEATQSKTFTITKFTEVTLNAQPSKVENLKPGMRVSITASGDPSVAARIAAQ